MTKTSGLGQNFYIGGFDLSGNVSAISAARGSWSTLDVTSINESAVERLQALRDGEISFNTWFDVAAGREHFALKTLPLTDVGVMYVTDVPALDAQAACLWAKQIDYNWARAQDGSLAGTVQTLANGYGLEWCEMLTAGIRVDTTGTAGAYIDFGSVSSAYGACAYLQVFSVTGTSVTVVVEDSASAGSGYSAITGLSFSAVTPGGAPTTQHLQTATGATIRRYVRATTSGTFSNAQFAVGFVRHLSTSI